MDFIQQKAERLGNNFLRNAGATKNREIIDKFLLEASSIQDNLERAKFLSKLLEINNSYYQEHLKTCTDPTNCDKNRKHEEVKYYLGQELRLIGVTIDVDAFSSEDKASLEKKLDSILEDLKEVKLGQQLIYEDLFEELQELKSLFFLGKKKWHQLLIGKGVEMVAGGVLSETLAHQIVEDVKKAGVGLLGI
jgi:hypothetical protein